MSETYHYSDLKKFRRCRRLFFLDRNMPRNEFHHYVRMDETLIDLVKQKLRITGCFEGQPGDDAELALNMLEQQEWLVNARFAYGDLRVRVPVLHRYEGMTDLYFLYLGLYPRPADPEYYSSTTWVLEHCGIIPDHIYIVHLNADYVRGESLDIDALIRISDCFYTDKNNPSADLQTYISEHPFDFTSLIHDMHDFVYDETEIPQKTSACMGRQVCRFAELCFVEEAEKKPDSLETLVSSQYKYDMLKEGRRELKDADPYRIEGLPLQYAQIMADRQGGTYADKAALRTWLDRIQYPIAFIDFEWERYAVPPYEGMRPFDVLPFEYSVHLLYEDGRVEHKIFLDTQDDRRDFIRGLIHDLPKSGSVVAYNASGAEIIRLYEMMEQFPQYTGEIQSIIDRVEDLQIPFENGIVYDVRMAGSLSLKTITGILDKHLYNDLDINQGMDAVYQWRRLDRNEADRDKQKIEEQLKQYCGMDTYAMVIVFRWLKDLVK